MENNVNNNVASNVNVSTGSVQSSVSSTGADTVQTVVSPTANTAVSPAATVNATVSPAASTIVSGSTNVGNTISGTTNVVKTNKQGNNNEQMDYKKFYIMMGILVGSVLLIAVILLIFLLNGSIGNRNRLTCTITTQEEGYTYHIKRYYTFDKKVMQRIYYTHTFTYKDELTDDMYNQLYDDIINNENYGTTRYGFSTKISKEGNVVTITSYDVNYYNDTLDTIKEDNAMQGYTCE